MSLKNGEQRVILRFKAAEHQDESLENKRERWHKEVQNQAARHQRKIRQTQTYNHHYISSSSSYCKFSLDVTHVGIIIW